MTHYRDDALEFSSEAEGFLGRLPFSELAADGRILGNVECPSGEVAECAVHFYNVDTDGIFGLFGAPPSEL